MPLVILLGSVLLETLLRDNRIEFEFEVTEKSLLPKKSFHLSLQDISFVASTFEKKQVLGTLPIKFVC